MDDTSVQIAAKKLAADLLASQVEVLRQRLTSSQLIDLAAVELDVLLTQADEIL